MKRTYRWYLEARHRALLPELAVGERTPLFLIPGGGEGGDRGGRDRRAWYMRLADLGVHVHPLAGIVRLEAPGALPLGETARLADECALALPRLASSPVRDPRAPQNLTPVGALEALLTRRLGEREWMRRLIASALRAAPEPLEPAPRWGGAAARSTEQVARDGRAGAAAWTRRRPKGWCSEQNRAPRLRSPSGPTSIRQRYLQLDDVVHVRSPLPDGQQVDFYGVVDELRAVQEGVRFASDVALASSGVLPAETAVSAHVSVTRVEPEIFVPPRPGEAVRRAHGAERDRALFFDAMTRRLPVGLSRGGEPIYANLDFLDGQRGAHVNISGVSGVATKTSYAMFLLYSLFGSGVLGHETANTRALVFNVKGEDLLFLDKPNAGLPEGDRARYAELGLEAAPFPSLRLFAPAARGDVAGPQTGSRMDGVTGFYWTLREFCAEPLSALPLRRRRRRALADSASSCSASSPSWRWPRSSRCPSTRRRSRSAASWSRTSTSSSTRSRA